MTDDTEAPAAAAGAGAGALGGLELVVRTIATTAVQNEAYFSELDSVVGDGDFGYSLARGFEVVLADWETLDRTDAAAFLRKVAMVITSRMGGTSGPLWGTAFLRAATVVPTDAAIDGRAVVAMLRAAAEGIGARGKSGLGDKTLLDALIPATDAIESALDAEADAASVRSAGASTARSAAEATAALEAKRGRASYTGERSIGVVDAGAVAVAVLFEAVSGALDQDRTSDEGDSK